MHGAVGACGQRSSAATRLQNVPGPSGLALAKQLVPHGLWERVFAYEVIVHHYRAVHALTRKDVTSLDHHRFVMC